MTWGGARPGAGRPKRSADPRARALLSAVRSAPPPTLFTEGRTYLEQLKDLQKGSPAMLAQTPPAPGSVHWYHDQAQAPAPSTWRVTLSDVLAMEILRNSGPARPDDRAKIEFMAEDIKVGNWCWHGQALTIEGGKLADGRKRCCAVLKAGRSIQTLICFRPLADQAAAHLTPAPIPAPIPATPALDLAPPPPPAPPEPDPTPEPDAIAQLTDAGFKWCAMTVAATRMILVFERSRGTTVNGGGSIPDAAIVDRVKADDAIQAAAVWASVKRRHLKFYLPATQVMVCFYLLAREHRKHAAAFLDRVIGGGGTVPGHPAYAVRRAIFSQVKDDPSTKLHREQQIDVVVQGWNAYRAGLDLDRVAPWSGTLTPLQGAARGNDGDVRA
jgi:hypothetical protein